MENNIVVNMENLTNEEREQLLKLVKKSNKTTKKRWRAKSHETYYYIGCDDHIYSTPEAYDQFDKKLYKLGNYFKTKEEAEFEVNKRLVYQELKDYALEHNECELDWADTYQAKWLIYYETGYPCLKYSDVYTICDIGQIYFSSEEIARKAAKTVGEDRIEKYLFGVE